MASYSGFIRKAPSHRMQEFFKARGIDIPDGFDWTSEGRGTVLVQSIDALLNELPDLQQDALKAELDHLASLADDNGMISAEQVCAGQGIDLEGLEGVQDVLLMLSTEHPKTLERVATQAALMRPSGGKRWSSFQFGDDGPQWALDDEHARNAFLTDTVTILDIPSHRMKEADWFNSVRADPITGEEKSIVRATIYVEDRAATELSFNPEAVLERHIVQKVVEIGLACDPQNRIVEICARGGKKVVDEYAKSFTARFAPGAEPPVNVPRREVTLERLRNAGTFETEPADGIEQVELSALDFYSTGGGFARFERRGDDETIYQFLERRFGEASPLRASGWQIVSATIRIILARKDGARRKTLTVTLRTPNTTTLPNKTEADWQFVISLLERWRLIAPHTPNEALIEAA